MTDFNAETHVPHPTDFTAALSSDLMSSALVYAASAVLPLCLTLLSIFIMTLEDHTSTFLPVWFSLQ